MWAYAALAVRGGRVPPARRDPDGVLKARPGWRHGAGDSVREPPMWPTGSYERDHRSQPDRMSKPTPAIVGPCVGRMTNRIRDVAEPVPDASVGRRSRMLVQHKDIVLEAAFCRLSQRLLNTS
jgi:hypothetical protein